MRFRALALLLLTVPPILCMVWLLRCPLGTACLSPQSVWSMLPLITILTVGLPVAAWAVRTVSLLVSVHRSVGRLQQVPRPGTLEAAALRMQLTIVCVDGTAPIAFTAGALRPRILVTTGLLQSLHAEQLDAVLLHEARHVRRRDPLRRAMLRALSEVYFYLPLIRAWMERQVQASELAADRAAIASVGTKAVARALLSVKHTPLEGVAAFAGTAEARVAQLLGDPVTVRPLPPRLWLLSTAGASSMLALSWCLAQLLVSI